MDGSFEFLDGEEVVLRVKLLKDRWMKYRCVTCSLRCISTIYLAPICVPLYAFLGGSCREEEADSFELVLTNQNIHFRQMIYGCGFCCQETNSKVIPLHRIQDISLVSDWIGDKCGVVNTPGEVYQVHVQTAAMGGMMPELCVFCIENPREFKKKVMEAKNRLAASAGADKGGAGATLQQASPQELARILAMLERQVQEKQ
jgi:hypothetical protein